MPRGAIQATNARSCDGEDERNVVERDGGRPDDQDHDGDEHERLGQNGSHLVGGDRGGDEHEQHPDEELDERLLESKSERLMSMPR